jgi:hypothetical protein
MLGLWSNGGDLKKIITIRPMNKCQKQAFDGTNDQVRLSLQA